MGDGHLCRGLWGPGQVRSPTDPRGNWTGPRELDGAPVGGTQVLENGLPSARGMAHPGLGERGRAQPESLGGRQPLPQRDLRDFRKMPPFQFLLQFKTKAAVLISLLGPEEFPASAILRAPQRKPFVPEAQREWRPPWERPRGGSRALSEDWSP